MTGYANLDAMFAEVDTFIQHAAARAEILPPGNDRDLLSATLQRLKEIRIGADKEVGAAVDWMKATSEIQLARVKDLQARIADTRAEVATANAKAATAAAAKQAERAAAAAAAVQSVTPALDPHLGSRLRDELLARFTGRTPVDPPPPLGKDIWESWE